MLVCGEAMKRRLAGVVDLLNVGGTILPGGVDQAGCDLTPSAPRLAELQIAGSCIGGLQALAPNLDLIAALENNVVSECKVWLVNSINAPL